MANVTVRTPDGQILQGPEENLAQLQASVPGAQVLSAEDAAAAQRAATLREGEGGARGAALAGLYGVAQGAVGLPVGETLERAFGRLTGGEKGEQEAIERMRVREQEQQAANIAGQVVGFGGAALATGGGAPAVRAATAGGRAIMAGGERAAAWTASKVAQEGLKRKIAAEVARGAVEGAALGAGQLVKEAVLDQDITHELVAERVLGGALLGGAGGGLFTGLGQAAVKAAEAAGTGTVGGLVGAGLGGVAGGIPGAIAGAAVGTAAGRAIGRGAAAGERAALAAARADAERAETMAVGKAPKGDLTPSEIARNLEEAEAERATAAAPGEAGTLEEAEADLSRIKGQQTENAHADLEYSQRLSDEVDAARKQFAEAPNSEAAAILRRKAAQAEEGIDQAARVLGHHREGLLAKGVEGYESAYETVTGRAKEKTMKRLANEMPEEEAGLLARDAKPALASRLGDLAGEIKGQIGENTPGLKRVFGAQVDQLERAKAAVSALPDTADGLAQAHTIVDRAKREFDRLLAKGPSSSATLDEQDVFRYFRQGAAKDILRDALQDSNIFGERIAATQMEINKAWREGIEPLKRFGKAFERAGLDFSEVDPFRLKNIVDPAKILPFIKGLGREEQEFAIEELQAFIASQIKLQQTAERLFAPSGRQAAKIREGIEALGKAQIELAKAKEHAVAKLAADQLSADAMQKLKLSVAGNIPAIGQMLTHVVDLQRRVVLEQALSRLAADADAKISAAAVKFVRGGERPGKLVAEAAKTVAREAAVDKPAPQIKPAQAVAKELATTAPKETREAMAREALKQMATVAAVAGSPAAMNAFAFQGTAPMQFTTDPRLATVVANASARAMAFLNAKRPPTFESDTLQPNLVNRQLTDSQLAQWRAYVTTAAKPLSVLDDLEKGTVRKEQVETLRALYPAIYSTIQSKILDTLHDSRAQVSFPQRVLLFQLFGSATDPSLRPQTMAAIQQSFAPVPPAAPRGGHGTPGNVRGSFAADYRTPSQSLAARGHLP